MSKLSIFLAFFIGIFLTVIIDFIVELLFFKNFLADYWLGDSVIGAVSVISAVILVGYSIPGYITAWMGKPGREISSGVTLAFLATPIIALLSSFRAPSSMQGFDPIQVLVYLGVALAIVIGSIIRGIQVGTFRGDLGDTENENEEDSVEHVAYPG